MELKKTILYENIKVASITVYSNHNRHFTVVEKQYITTFFGFPSAKDAIEYFKVIDEGEVQINLEPIFFYQMYNGQLYSQGFYFMN